MDRMDRLIDPADHRRRIIRRAVSWIIVAIAVLGLLVALISWLRPTVRRDRVRTTTVVRQEMTATLDASGLVVPMFEQVLTAPVATRVTSILKTRGARIEAGEPIVLLDDKDARREVNRLEEQIKLERNLRVQKQLEQARQNADLQSQHEIKELELRSFEFELERSKRLFEMELVVEDAVRKAETDVARCRIELRNVSSSMALAKQDLEAQLEGLALKISILEKDLDRATERLEGTTISSDRAGIVTWVVPSEGAMLADGEAAARVADLSSYRVDATLSDVLARRLVPNLPVTVRTGDTRLSGSVRKVIPTVQNGIVTFEVTLDDESNPVLRPNLRVDVHVVTEQHARALCMKRGPILNVQGNDAVFVIRGGKAVRTDITLGISNFEYYEVLSGLVEGDEVIISDMSDYRNVKEAGIR